MTTRLILLAFSVFLFLGGCVRRQGVERVEWSVMGTVAAMQAKRMDEGRGPSPGEDVIRRMSTEVRGVFTSVETLLNGLGIVVIICFLIIVKELISLQFA